MTDFFIRLYNIVGEKNVSFLGIRIFSATRFLVRTIANKTLPVYYNLTKRKYQLNEPTNGQPLIIISLTSFPKRIQRLWVVIETLMRQTKKPDFIILWLSKQQFDTIDSLPKKLLALQNRGLKIYLVDEDYRSHKKYLYVLKNYPNDFIITVDDDIFYSKNLIQALWNKHLEFPDAVICNYAFEIIRNEDSIIAPYEDWKRLRSETEPQASVFFGSGGGTLFPPQSLHPDVLKTEVCIKLCAHADDIWLNTMVRLNNKKIAKAKLISTILPVQNQDDSALATFNLVQGQNNIQLASVRKFYKTHNNVDPFD